MYNNIRHSVLYRTPTGSAPFSDYVDSLKDIAGAGKIAARIDRARLGNLGDHRSVGHGVIELRIDFGPGYRIYIGLEGNELIVLLCAGDKASQAGDIQKAVEYWIDHGRKR